MSKVVLKKIGTDYLVNLPSDLIKMVGAKEGDILDFRINTEKNIEIELQSNDVQKNDVQKEVLAIHDQLMDEYSSAFERLAQ